MAPDPGNNFSTAQNIGLLNRTRAFSNSVSKQDKFDFYQLRLSNRSALTGVLRKLTDNADLALFNGDRQRIALSTQPGTQNKSVTTVLDKGDYFVRVGRKGGTTNYRLILSIAPPPDLAGNDQGTARSITVGSTPTTFSDAVGTTDSDDFYQFTTTAFGNLDLNLTGLSADANVQLTNVVNGVSTVVRSSIAGDATQESIKAGLQAGTYFIRVFPGSSSATTDYDLNLALTPLKLVGLANNNSLVSFNLGDSTNATGVGITGLASGETLLGIDFRPATGQLYGVSSTSKIYTLDSTTGQATQVGTSPFISLLSGTSFGIDFNPVPDRIRFVSDAEENLRLNPDTGALAGIDTSLSPAGNVVASAYTNNRTGVTSTTLFGIDSASDSLVRQGGVGGTPSPNGGALTTIGALGADFNSSAGFDIFTDGTGVDFAFAASGSALYSINLGTGAATSLGTVNVSGSSVTLVGLAARP